MTLHGKGVELHKDFANLFLAKGADTDIALTAFAHKYGKETLELMSDNFLHPMIHANGKSEMEAISYKLTLFCSAFANPI